jgi:putative ABC transport system permease protein
VSRFDRDLADEIQDFLERATAAHIARGLSPEDALRAARLELGGVTQVTEHVRSARWAQHVETFAADLRFAARRLRVAPGFTIITVLTLALGLGASTAIFSAVYPVLFQPLPYPDPGRIAMVWYRGTDGARAEQTFGTHRELVERVRGFEMLAAMKPWQPTLIGLAEPERLEGQRVSAGYLDVLGVKPAMGSAFTATDDRAGGANVVVISDALWRRRFNSDRAIVGRSITLDDDLFVVAGVMPPSFENVLAPDAEIWAPLQYDMSQGRAWGHHLRIVGRLRPGTRLEDARRELDAVARAPIAEFPRQPWAAAEQGFIANSLHDEVTRGAKPALLAILGAVVLVLVIACVNVTNLLLARDARRHGEFALRTALGAGQSRLIRQLLSESMVLAVLGGAAGSAIAVAGMRALVALSPAKVPRLDAIGVNGAVLAFGVVITTLVGLMCGMIPAIQAARSNPQAALQAGTRRMAGGSRRTRSVLVVAEVALALMLLVSSGLLLRSLERLFAIDVGFDESRLLTLQVQTAGRRFATNSTTYQFFAQTLDAVRQLPGVAGAALTSQLPLGGDRDLYGVRFEPAPADDPGELGGTFRYAVSPGFFETMGLPVQRGRALDARDRAGAPLAAVISASLAQRRLAGRDPLGRRLIIGSGEPYTVVGVVGDVKQQSLASNDADAVYVTATQWRFADNAMTLVVRARDDATALAPAVRQAIWAVDKDQPIVRVATMDALIAASAAERRFALRVFQAFALAALVLAATGLYGVLSGSVTERTREIGVRAALGASRGSLLGLVVRQGMTLTGLGVAIGVGGAVAATQAIASLLFGVSPLDPLTYLGVITLLAVVALLASAVPAWRAMRVDPATALRAE